MEPIEAYYKIREACLRRPELRHKDEKHDPTLNIHPLLGFCYISTEVFCYLIKDARPYFIPEKNHCFAKIGDKVWDLTPEQFSHVLNYDQGYRRNRKPLTRRAKKLLEETVVS